MRDILVIGSLNMDLVAVAPHIPVIGETVTGDRYFHTPGGKGANQAYAASRLGGRVAMIGKVGDDAFGTQLVDDLAASGCRTTHVTRSRDHSGIALITVSRTGENSIVIVPGANAALSPQDLPAAMAGIAAAPIVLLQLESPIDTIVAAAKLARQEGAFVILDPAPAPDQPLPDELVANVDLVTPNETEALRLSGRQDETLAPDMVNGIAADLHAMGYGAVILKLGARGCFLSANGDEMMIAAPTVTAVDSTAAGDTFNGALAIAIAEGVALADACRFAVAAAAVSVTRLGAQASMPTRGEVDRLLS